MAKQQKAWTPKPAKTSKTAIPDAIKLELETKAANLIETGLKPKHVVPQKPDIEFNYISDIDVGVSHGRCCCFSLWAIRHVSLLSH